MLKVTIDIDKTFIKDFTKAALGVEDTIKDGLIKAMFYAESQAKLNFNKPGKPTVRTGRLRSSISSGVNGLTGWVGTNVNYAEINEFGGTIRPKHGEYLKFKIQGQWKSVKEVIIPARPFIGPAINNNLSEMSDIILNELLEAFE